MHTHMSNFIYKIFIKSRNLLLFSFLLAMSCEEWTPQADGYYIIDGKRYNVHIMAIYRATFPEPSNNNIEVILQGASAYNVVMFVSVPANTLSAGTYHVSYGYEPLGINSISILRGNISEVITSDINSEGNMTVEVSGQNYVMDFNGKIKGRTVQIHYAGLVSIQ
jgi:hypothetical protein